MCTYLRLRACPDQREKHERKAGERMARMVLAEDNPVLLELDGKYKGAKFYDAQANECREIDRIEWNDDDTCKYRRFQAITYKIYK